MKNILNYLILGDKIKQAILNKNLQEGTNKMFDNIGEKIKILAKTIGILGTVVGAIVFIYAFVSYSENAEYEKYLYEYSYSFLQDAAVAAVAAKTTMKWSAASAKGFRRCTCIKTEEWFKEYKLPR